MTKRTLFFICSAMLMLASLSFGQNMGNDKVVYHAPYTIRWTQCAFGNDGVLWVVWSPGDTNPKTGGGHIYVVKYDGTSVSEPFMVSANTTSRADRPHIASSSKGHILVTWGIRATTTVGMRVWNPKTKVWGDIETVAQGYGDFEPCGQIDGNGNVHVLFMKEGQGMVFVRSKINGVWENVVRLNTIFAKQGSLVRLPNGNLNAVWVQKNASGFYQNVKSKRTLTTRWTAPEVVPGLGKAANHPWLAAGPNNIPVLAWMDIPNPAKENGAEIRVLQIGSGKPRDIVSPFVAQHNPRVAVDTNNNIHVVVQLGAGDSGLGIRYTNNIGGTWHEVQTLAGSYPKVGGVAADPFGNVAACQSMYTREGTDIRVYSLKPIQKVIMPEADFTFSPTTGYPPLTVGFHATPAYEASGKEVTYAWAFSEGGTATGRDVSHLYETAGTYTITLTITDSLNRTDDISQTIEVKKTNPLVPFNPTANISMSSMWKNPEITFTLSWEINPSNVPAHIQGYAIYMKEGTGAYTRLLTVSSSTLMASFNFTDLRVKRAFAVSTLGYGGTESPMAYFQ
ncbi:MAG: PKD domain-containing protein [Candidatus Aminicenantales bacterium]